MYIYLYIYTYVYIYIYISGLTLYPIRRVEPTPLSDDLIHAGPPPPQNRLDINRILSSCPRSAYSIRGPTTVPCIHSTLYSQARAKRFSAGFTIRTRAEQHNFCFVSSLCVFNTWADYRTVYSQHPVFTRNTQHPHTYTTILTYESTLGLPTKPVY